MKTLFTFLFLFLSFSEISLGDDKVNNYRKKIDSIIFYKKFETYSSDILERIKKNHGNISMDKWPTFLKLAEKNIGSKNYNSEIAITLSAKFPDSEMSEIENVFNSPVIQKLISVSSTNTDQLANEKDPTNTITKTLEQFKSNGEFNIRQLLVKVIDRDLTFESELFIKEEIYHEIRNDFGRGIDVFSLDYKKQIAQKSTDFMKNKNKIESELLYCTKDLSIAEIKQILEMFSKPRFKTFFNLIKQTVFNLRNKSEADFLVQYRTYLGQASN